MTAVRFITGSAARGAAADSLATAERVVSQTIGPDGRAAIFVAEGAIRRAETGVECMRHCTDETFATRLLREAVVAFDRDFGDGTSRLILMTCGALRVGFQAIASGVDPVALAGAVERMTPALDRAFDAAAEPIDAPIAILRSAKLASSTQAKVGEAIGLAGDDEIEVYSVPGSGVALVTQEGYVADVTPALSSTPPWMGSAWLLVVNDVIHHFGALIPVIEGFVHSDKTLVIVARGIEGAARQLLERNRRDNILRVAIFVPRETGPRAAEALRDLAIACGACLIGDEAGLSLDRTTPSMLGRAEKLTYTDGRLLLTSPAGDPGTIACRRRLVAGEVTKNRYLSLDREHAIRRRARLAGRVLELRIGEQDDGLQVYTGVRRALASWRLARAHGVIAGGGRGLATIAASLSSSMALPHRETDGERPNVREDSDASAAACHLIVQALRATGQSLAHTGRPMDGRLGDPLSIADPVFLSRELLRVALALSTHILKLDAAVLRTSTRTEHG